MNKIKSFWGSLAESRTGKRTLSIAGIIIFGACSFLLGRLTKSNLSPGIKVEYPDWPKISQETNSLADSVENSLAASAIKAQNETESLNSTDTAQYGKSAPKGDFFASSKGKKYYPVGCSAGKSIKLENRIYFNTSKEAESAGYELSSSCQ